MASRQSRLVIGLSVILALVAVISVGLLLVVPTEPMNSLEDVDTDVSAVPPGGQVFDLSAVQSQLYQALDKQLVQEGALPVKPPAVVGKVNPFL